ncbi:MAG: hypothetical protein IPO70_09515 [Bacteroidetes bacterium]|nr:hypothetical protein [Bacteroidota bacterium]
MSATNLSSTPIGATLAWTNSNTDIGLGSIGSGNVPAFFTTNSTTSAINGSIDVTLTLNGCAGTAVNYVITVNPTPFYYCTIKSNSLSRSFNECDQFVINPNRSDFGMDQQ